MKYLLILSFSVALVYSCNILNYRIGTGEQTEIFKVIFNSDRIFKIFNLENDSTVSEIRLIDLTKSFKFASDGYIKTKHKYIFITTYYKLKVDLNCGFKKDIVLTSFKREKDKYYLRFIASSTECTTDNKKLLYSINFELLKKNNGTFDILNSTGNLDCDLSDIEDVKIEEYNLKKASKNF
ncbi:MAG: hypothetical protein H6567_08200 [Lewinellaceae bacterium]|nr:hypothetical protein [Lewinellaceae bacterium]